MSKPDDEQRRLAEAAEKQLELPPGLLQRYLDNGGQIDAKQRAMVLDAYGIDPKLSKRNAVDAAGLALQDALQRNNGDPAIAIAELHGGQDRSKWNKGVNDFAARVSMPPPAPRAAGRRSASGMQMQAQAGNRSASGMTAPAPQQSAPVEGMTPADPAEADAQQSMMPDDEIAAVEARTAPVAAPTPAAAAPVQAAPVGAPPAGEMEAPAPLPAGAIKAAGPKTLEAYRNGTLDPAKRKMFEDFVRRGELAVPAGFQLQAATPQGAGAPAAQPAQAAEATPVEEPGLIDRAMAIPGAIKEAFTGDKRRVESTEALPSWGDMPEWNQLPGLSGSLKKLAAAAASPREALQILQSNAPGVTIREDEKGNLIAFSPMAKGEFAVHPGFDKGDAVRALFTLPAYAATAATGGLPAIMAKEALVQTGVEAAQASSGGEFNPSDVLLAAATPVALAAGGAAKNAVGSVLRKGANAALDMVPGSVTREAAQAAAPVASDIAGEAATTTLRDVGPTGIGGARAAAPVAEAAAQAAPPIKDPADIAEMLVAASKKGPAADAAKADLAKLAAVDPKIAAAAERLGVDVPVDVMSGNEQFKNLMGLARSKIGSEAQAEFAGAVDGIVKRADEVMKDFGAVVVEGAPSSSAVSGRVLDRMKGMQAELKQAASAAHESIAEVIPKTTKVNVSGALAEMQKIVSEVGANSLSTAERKLQTVLSDPNGVTYQALKRQKDLIGKALEGQDSPFSNMATGDLKRLYGLIAQAQEEAVRGVGGDALVKQLKAANALTVAQKGIEERMVAGFGKEANGDLADKMTRAITAAKTEKTKPLDDLLAIVPEDMHREVIATAIAKVTSGKDGVFSPEKFVDFYLGMRSNPAAMAKVDKIMGRDVTDAWRALFEVSKAVATAKPKVKFTGIGNQELEAAIMGNGLIGKVLSSSAARKGVAGAAGAAAGAMTGSPLVAGGVGVAASAGLDAIVNARASVLPVMGKLFTTPEFKALAIAGASGAVDTPAVKEAVRKVAISKPFRDWWKAAQGATMKYDPRGAERWILAAMQAAQSEREQ
jgi:predicted negative regulator of RcsB-dependent stress response